MGDPAPSGVGEGIQHAVQEVCHRGRGLRRRGGLTRAHGRERGRTRHSVDAADGLRARSEQQLRGRMDGVGEGLDDHRRSGERGLRRFGGRVRHEPHVRRHLRVQRHSGELDRDRRARRGVRRGRRAPVRARTEQRLRGRVERARAGLDDHRRGRGGHLRRPGRARRHRAPRHQRRHPALQRDPEQLERHRRTGGLPDTDRHRGRRRRRLPDQPGQRGGRHGRRRVDLGHHVDPDPVAREQPPAGPSHRRI